MLLRRDPHTPILSRNISQIGRVKSNFAAMTDPYPRAQAFLTCLDYSESWQVACV
jgi:hypothetical protein